MKFHVMVWDYETFTYKRYRTFDTLAQANEFFNKNRENLGDAYVSEDFTTLKK